MNATPSRSNRNSPARQRGVAALAVTMLLLFALLLAVGFVNRNLIFEQRASANQYRSTQAFEAAEAGLEWALAQLNDNQRIGADCLPTTDATATSFRARYLRYDAPSAAYSAATWSDAGVVTPLRPTCVRADAGWTCSCPSNGRAVLTPPAGTVPAPAFTVRFQNAGSPGLVRAIAVGCTSLGAECAPAGVGTTDASARMQVLFGLLPGIRTAPAAALTVRGSVHAGSAAFGAHNRDAASGGLAIHAGGAVNAALAHLSVPAGASTSTAVAGSDTALAGLTPSQFFATYFGIERNTRANQPVVRRLSCSTDCTAALRTAIGHDAESSLVHVDGDLQIQGPATLGSRERPVVIVASGAIRFEGPVVLNGVAYGGSVAWNHTGAPGALVRGALISEGDYQGDGTPEIVYDAEVLARLKGNAGTFTRVNGSWGDF